MCTTVLTSKRSVGVFRKERREQIKDLLIAGLQGLQQEWENGDREGRVKGKSDVLNLISDGRLGKLFYNQ